MKAKSKKNEAEEVGLTRNPEAINVPGGPLPDDWPKDGPFPDVVGTDGPEFGILHSFITCADKPEGWVAGRWTRSEEERWLDQAATFFHFLAVDAELLAGGEKKDLGRWAPGGHLHTLAERGAAFAKTKPFVHYSYPDPVAVLPEEMDMFLMLAEAATGGAPLWSFAAYCDELHAVAVMRGDAILERAAMEAEADARVAKAEEQAAAALADKYRAEGNLEAERAARERAEEARERAEEARGKADVAAAIWEERAHKAEEKVRKTCGSRKPGRQSKLSTREWESAMGQMDKLYKGGKSKTEAAEAVAKKFGERVAAGTIRNAYSTPSMRKKRLGKM